MEEIKVSILIPYLNQERNLKSSIIKAQMFLNSYEIKGEIIIIDNMVNSNKIENKTNFKVIHIDKEGLGSALEIGTNEANGKYIVIGDANDTYDFLNLKKFVEKIDEGYDLVIGNRYLGGIEGYSMSLISRYISNPLMSFLGKRLFSSNLKDFGCVLRIYNKERIKKLNLECENDEYLYEMLISSHINNYKVTEISTTFSRNNKKRKPCLNGFQVISFMFKMYFNKDKYKISNK